MGPNSPQQQQQPNNNSHPISMWEANKDRLGTMYQMISEPPRLLSNAAGKPSCCIFRVPQSLVEINGKSYNPHIVSIGPYHRGEPRLKMIEEHKWKYLGSLLARTEPKGLTLKDYLKALEPLEQKARECYSENINLSTDEFLEMLVLDGCFIIELFRKFGLLVRWKNRLDFGSGGDVGMHLLDLLRSSVIPPGHEEPRSSNTIPTHTIHCVSKLRRAGIKFNPGKDESFLVIKFKRGVIEMPPITIDDFMSSFLLNCVAYEQCHKSSSKHITTYATLLDCLVNTYKDVEYLSDRNIIENCFGNDGEVARFINNLGKDVAFDMDRCYLAKLFNDVHDYYGNSWHVQWASFKYTYFDTPWSFISAFAALILLILTLMQTFYTVLSYYHI
ncbi:hypothetical protein DVH24_034988 [Malus domestica]|uniref:Uncharacterized protein n=1 Tax=Malus domestica TaxID=3750 RepID=A0A498IHT1_MALDO|nr:hypothetical protein DVH24_034988 [Malus domestica]